MKALVNNLYLYYCFACRRLGIPSYQVHQICLPEQELAYIPIPKNACSSIMHMLYIIENGEEYDMQHQRTFGYRDIHDFYQKRSDSFTSVETFSNLPMKTFTVIRDPVSRLISCYGNRVMKLSDLKKNEDDLKKQGLPVKPNLDTFVLNLESYRSVSKSVEHHSRHQYDFLGGTLRHVDRVFPIEQMDEVYAMLKKYDSELELRSDKAGDYPYSLRDLSEKALDFALQFYGKDYDLFEDYYSAEKVRKEYESTVA